MAIQHIQSLQHPIVKELVRLRSNNFTRAKEKKVLVTCKKMIEELSLHFEIGLLISSKISCLKARKKYLASKEILKKITTFAAQESTIAIFDLPEEQNLVQKNYLLALDELQDPGNLGTIFRSAYALGFEGIILTPNTVDPFNDKALRASKGAVFHMPYQKMSKQALVSLSITKNTFVADTQGEPINKCTFSLPILLILSSEGQGADFTFQNSCTRITIPLMQNMESLNVATAASILMYQMRPK